MVYSSTAVAGDELAAFNLDRPCLVGSHVMRDEFDPDTTGNVWTTIGETTSADETEAGFDTWRAWDGHAHETLYTRPDAANTEWYYTLNPSGLNDFDMIAIWGENLDTADELIFTIADDAAFTLNVEDIVTLSAETRMVSLFQARYSGVLYARLQVNSLGGGVIPRINEIWIGRRRQLLHNVTLPWDNRHEVSAIVEVVSPVAIASPRTIRRGVGLRNADIRTGSDAEFAALSGWHSESLGGSRSFIWIETPSSNPQVRIVVANSGAPDFRSRRAGPFRREFSLAMREINPFLARPFP